MKHIRSLSRLFVSKIYYSPCRIIFIVVYRFLLLKFSLLIFSWSSSFGRSCVVMSVAKMRLNFYRFENLWLVLFLVHSFTSSSGPYAHMLTADLFTSLCFFLILINKLIKCEWLLVQYDARSIGSAIRPVVFFFVENILIDSRINDWMYTSLAYDIRDF